ncbi:outer membrane lipoprotein carrier protein LolA [Thermocrinis minervae]|uniref:Outer membrane lipoprotein carrier protein n=1 Tax=Thermocrinis minervae TaxID=381751 RepID=A0A1M6QFU8_9AQUI|nr:outer membrane lipoprotein carrier protein LolA [Thermocrinis minervae]SHK19048.1 outer membrane lipoprotein carrier protein [Thermocrinis minervae]
MMFLLILILPLLVWSDTLSNLSKKLEKVRTIRVDFIQRVQYPWSARPEISKGIIYAQKGGKFRIEYTSPQRLLIVSNGKDILIEYPGKNIRYIDNIQNNRSSVVEAIFLLSKPLEDVFKPVLESSRNGKVMLTLVPKVKDSTIERVTLELEDLDIRKMWIEAPDGTRVELEFINIKENFTPSPNLFTVWK